MHMGTYKVPLCTAYTHERAGCHALGMGEDQHGTKLQYKSCVGLACYSHYYGRL